MKYYFILLILFLLGFSSCSEFSNNSSTIFYMQDSLYKVSFDKPIELDTFYDWKDEDDNACSDVHKYRFSKKNFPPQKETGFFGTSYADSTYRLTFEHVEEFDCKSNKNNRIFMSPDEYREALELKAKSDGKSININYIKELKINEKIFLLCAYQIDESYINKYLTHYLKGITMIDGNAIRITADCRTGDCNDFIESMENTFETIRIE